jgi:uncharacterized protein (DUF3084 family)
MVSDRRLLVANFCERVEKVCVFVGAESFLNGASAGNSSGSSLLREDARHLPKLLGVSRTQSPREVANYGVDLYGTAFFHFAPAARNASLFLA